MVDQSRLTKGNIFLNLQTMTCLYSCTRPGWSFRPDVNAEKALVRICLHSGSLVTFKMFSELTARPCFTRISFSCFMEAGSSSSARFCTIVQAAGRRCKVAETRFVRQTLIAIVNNQSVSRSILNRSIMWFASPDRFLANKQIKRFPKKLFGGGATDCNGLQRIATGGASNATQANEVHEVSNKVTDGY